MVYAGGKIKKTCFSQSFVNDSDHQSTESGAAVGSNDDLLTEILLRLPVASVLRFKSVSKHWLLLLSDSRFINRYDKLSKSPGFFASGIYVPFDPEDRNAPFFNGHIVQSCNGLLLCRNRDRYEYYVLNPTTKQVATIPPVPGVILAASLVFHPTDCVHYKVICVGRLKLEKFQILIYSSDTGKWKVSIESFHPNTCFLDNGVYCNGVVYWPLSDSDGKLLYYNIEAEQLQTSPFPLVMMPLTTFKGYFGESRGHLHLIVGAYGGYKDSLHINVYEMLRDRSGWFVKYHVQLDGLPEAFPETIESPGYNFDVVDVLRGEDAFMVLAIPGKFLKYHLHHKSFEQILSYPHNKYYRRSNIQRYIATLSSF
ncbi:F-box protein At5g07610-like [Bidens hawaiensis]|uniref:F-box protein At5g07610-like n=1 Tax=Bidens hawaiensis TaxID=980011 RepID=UPI004049D6DB